MFEHVWTCLDTFWQGVHFIIKNKSAELLYTEEDALHFGHDWTCLDMFGHVLTHLVNTLNILRIDL